MFNNLFSNLVYFFVFLFGLGAGSFLNCLIYRFETGQSFLKGRSFCPYCHHLLSWQDLIPLLSFLILKGKCRYCQKKISWQYPLVEIATGILFVLILNYAFPNLLVTGYWLLVTSFLIIIFVYDLKHFIIPDKIVYPAIATVLVYNLISDFYLNHLTIKPFNHSLFFSGISAATLASASFLAIVLISRGKWMGVGDIKLAFFMGLFLGFPNIIAALFLAFLIGAIIGLGLVIAGRKTLKSEVPFGPFLVTGTFIALFWGDKIIDLYLNFFAY